MLEILLKINLTFKCFVVVTDNAANMKCAFHMAAVENDDTSEFHDNSTDMHKDDEDEFVEPLEGWTVTPIHFDSWIGCAAHKLQLIIHDTKNYWAIEEFNLPFVRVNPFVLSLVILNMHYLPKYYGTLCHLIRKI